MSQDYTHDIKRRGGGRGGEGRQIPTTRTFRAELPYTADRYTGRAYQSVTTAWSIPPHRGRQRRAVEVSLTTDINNQLPGDHGMVHAHQVKVFSFSHAIHSWSMVFMTGKINSGTKEYLKSIFSVNIHARHKG